MRDSHKAMVYVRLRLQTNASRYSHWCFTVLEEKLYKWTTLLYIVQLGTVHPNRGSAQYSFLRLSNFFWFLTWVIHPSFIEFYQHLHFILLTSHTQKKSGKGLRKCPSMQSPEATGICTGKNYRGKRPSQPTSVRAPLTLLPSVRHFCGHSWILLMYVKVEDAHSS